MSPANILPFSPDLMPKKLLPTDRLCYTMRMALIMRNEQLIKFYVILLYKLFLEYHPVWIETCSNAQCYNII